MAEFGDGAPKVNPIIPKTDGTIGSVAWDRFPKEIFPIATGLAVRIVSDPKYAGAYELSKKVRRAEDLLKMTRRRTVGLQNTPSKEEDPDIAGRWSDEEIESDKRTNEKESIERQAEVTGLNEALRERNTNPDSAKVYEDVDAQISQIVMLAIEGFRAEIDKGKAIDALTLMGFNRCADQLIDYNLSVLAKQK